MRSDVQKAKFTPIMVYITLESLEEADQLRQLLSKDTSNLFHTIKEALERKLMTTNVGYK